RRRSEKGRRDRLGALRWPRAGNQARWQPARALPAAVRTDFCRADRRGRCGFEFHQDPPEAWPRTRDMDLPRRLVYGTPAVLLSGLLNRLEYGPPRNGSAPNMPGSPAPRIQVRGA